MMNVWDENPIPGSYLEQELRQREIQNKLKQCGARLLSRERVRGHLGSASRSALLQRLKQLQKSKEENDKKAQSIIQNLDPYAPQGCVPSPSSVVSPSVSVDALHDLNASSLQLRQAKAAYWSELDQLAPQWKSGGAARRLDELTKYERAIDSLLARRQAAAAAYAKERELQRLLAEKQLQYQQLSSAEIMSVLERESVRSRFNADPQSALLTVDGGAPGPASQPTASNNNNMQQTHKIQQQQHTIQQIHQQQSIHSHHQSPFNIVAFSSSTPIVPLSSMSSPSLVVPPVVDLSDAPHAVDEPLDIDNWKEELAMENELRQQRREERQLMELRERRLENEKRKSIEAEIENEIRRKYSASQQLFASTSANVPITNTPTAAPSISTAVFSSSSASSSSPSTVAALSSLSSAPLSASHSISNTYQSNQNNHQLAINQNNSTPLPISSSPIPSPAASLLSSAGSPSPAANLVDAKADEHLLRQPAAHTAAPSSTPVTNQPSNHQTSSSNTNQSKQNTSSKSQEEKPPDSPPSASLFGILLPRKQSNSNKLTGKSNPQPSNTPLQHKHVKQALDNKKKQVEEEEEEDDTSSEEDDDVGVKPSSSSDVFSYQLKAKPVRSKIVPSKWSADFLNGADELDESETNTVNKSNTKTGTVTVSNEEDEFDEMNQSF